VDRDPAFASNFFSIFPFHSGVIKSGAIVWNRPPSLSGEVLAEVLERGEPPSSFVLVLGAKRFPDTPPRAPEDEDENEGRFPMAAVILNSLHHF
jgi:hypothetical protein